MLGWVAATGQFGIEPGMLFMIQFFWQFPHFWAIGWLQFDEYKKAVPELTISKEWKLKEELKRNKEETKSSKVMVNEELRSNKEEIADMKERFAHMEDILEELSKRD